jgi:hypothetical protein
VISPELQALRVRAALAGFKVTEYWWPTHLGCGLLDSRWFCAASGMTLEEAYRDLLGES